VAKKKEKDSSKKKSRQEQTFLSTKQVAEIISNRIGSEIDTRQLRIYIRDSDLFDGQRGKRYQFSEDDRKIDALVDYIEKRRKKSAEADEGGKKAGKGKGKKSDKQRRKTKPEPEPEEDGDENDDEDEDDEDEED